MTAFAGQKFHDATLLFKVVDLRTVPCSSKRTRPLLERGITFDTRNRDRPNRRKMWASISKHCTQRGSSPWSVRSLQRVHSRPRLARALRSLGIAVGEIRHMNRLVPAEGARVVGAGGYAHATTDALISRSPRDRNCPCSARGAHALARWKVSQCWHAKGRCDRVRLGYYSPGRRPLRLPSVTTRPPEALRTPFCILHAKTQVPAANATGLVDGHSVSRHNSHLRLLYFHQHVVIGDLAIEEQSRDARPDARSWSRSAGTLPCSNA